MGKMKKKINSLKWSLFLYLPFCLIFSFIGAFAIGIGTNCLQDWFQSNHYDNEVYNDSSVETVIDENGIEHYILHDESMVSLRYDIRYLIISDAQFVLIPLWVIFCFGATGAVFYNRELKKPIQILMDASKKISDNQLDFKVEYKKQNELGTLCTAFDDMRLALYENNRELWRSLEERKRLNSAFSHDLRTPLTVLHGYVDFLQKYVPDGKVTEEKLINVLTMMNGQIIRLEHYTQKMNAVQKLEDIVPVCEKITVHKLYEMFCETGNQLCGNKKFTCSLFPPDNQTMLNIDTELIMQIYENLVSNAVRYAESSVSAVLHEDDKKISITVSDDGKGFSDEGLIKAGEPFFRDEKYSQTHFGLGLYISRILCEKCGGTMSIRNNEKVGATVEIIFQK